MYQMKENTLTNPVKFDYHPLPAEFVSFTVGGTTPMVSFGERSGR